MKKFFVLIISFFIFLSLSGCELLNLDFYFTTNKKTDETTTIDDIKPTTTIPNNDNSSSTSTDSTSSSIINTTTNELAQDIEIRLEKNRYGLDTLDDDKLIRLYNAIDNEVKSFDSNLKNVGNDNVLANIRFSTYSLSLEEFMNVYSIYLLDNPDYYYLSNSITYNAFSANILIDGYKTKAERDDMNNRLNTKLNELKDLLIYAEDDLDKYMIIHKYICDNTNYAYDDDGNPSSDSSAHNITGFMLGKNLVCEGYSEVFKLFSNYFQLECINVTGTSRGEGHEWSMIKVNGNYYFVDVTWDDLDSVGATYTYFGLSLDKLLLTHSINTIESPGLNYLYNLPQTPSSRIAINYLYEDDVFIGKYLSLDDAFNAMTNESSSYTIDLFEYFEKGLYSTRISGPTVTFESNIEEFPRVKSLSIISDALHNNTDKYTQSRIIFNNNIKLNSNLTLENVYIKTKDLNMNGYDITFSSYQNILESESVIGSSNETIYDKTSYQVDLYTNLINIHTIDVLNNYFSLSANTANIQTLNLRNPSTYLEISDTLEYICNDIRITSINTYSDSNTGIILFDELKELEKVVIEDINIPRDKYNPLYVPFFLLGVHIKERTTMPYFEITGTLNIVGRLITDRHNLKLYYQFSGNNTTYTTNELGEIINVEDKSWDPINNNPIIKGENITINTLVAIHIDSKSYSINTQDNLNNYLIYDNQTKTISLNLSE